MSLITILGFIIGSLFAGAVKFAPIPVADGLHRLHLPFSLAQTLATEPAVQIAFGAGFGGLIAVLVGMAIPAFITSRTLSSVQVGVLALPVSGAITQGQLSDALDVNGFIGEALKKYVEQARADCGKLVSGHSAANYLARTGLGFGLFRLLPKLILMLGLIICVYAVTQGLDKQIQLSGDANTLLLGLRAGGSALLFAGVAACASWLVMQLIEAKLLGQLIELGQSLDSRVPVIAESVASPFGTFNAVHQDITDIKNSNNEHLEKISTISQSHHQASAQLMDAISKLALDTKSFGAISAELSSAAKMSHETVDKFVTLAERMSDLHKQINVTTTQPTPAYQKTSGHNGVGSEPTLTNSETANRLSSAIKNLRDTAATEALPELK